MSAGHTLLDGTRILGHRVEVPLDWASPSGQKVSVFAREFIGAEALAKGEVHVAGLPFLLFLQGGPGGKGTRPARVSGWMEEALKDFRLIMLDQRGTGLSAPLNRRGLASLGTPADQATFLRHFRADSIVKDAEALRQHLGIRSWSLLGQSYGGFCALSYLSMAPDSLDRALITGGLAPLTGHADQVYRHTYPRMTARNAEYFSRFPEDRQRLDRVVSHLRTHHVRLLDGSPLTVPRLQLLGMLLGGNTRVDTLHYLLEEAFTGPDARELSDTFLSGVGQQLSFAENPMYAVLHESIYGQPAEVSGGRGDTGWAAERVLGQFPAFSAEADSPLLLGEMILREHLRLDPTLVPLFDAAEELASWAHWKPLYDLDQLAANAVPAAAAVYRDDVYVSRELSLETAAQVKNLSVWETSRFHHDGLHEDGPGVLRELLSRTEK